MINRSSLRILLVTTVLCFGGSAFGQDEVRYYDRAAKKELAALGSIQEESPAGITYKAIAGASSKEIPAGDIVDVIYEVPAALNQAYRRARADERKNPVDAIKDYQELQTQLRGDKYAHAARQIQFKIAIILAQQAEDDPAQAPAAIGALDRFRKEQAGGWQLLHCARALSRLQLLKGDSVGARKAFEDLASISGIPAEIKQEAELLAVEAMVFGKQYADAEKRLQSLLAALPADSLQGVRIRIELAHCQGASGKLAEASKELELMIAQIDDKSLKAHAYNALGDCYQRNAKDREALWPYLWVDVIYHQDRREHVRAMEQLAKIFEEQGNKDKARIYREKLKKPER